MSRRCGPVRLLLVLALLWPGIGWGAELMPLGGAPWEPGPDSPPPQETAANELQFSLPFHQSLDRVYWDLPIRPIPRQAGGITLDITCDNPAAIRAITLYVQSAGNWLAATAIPAAGRQTLFFPGADFRAEDSHADWTRANRLRLSIWRGAGRSATLILHGIQTDSPPIAVITATSATAPGQEALAKECAQRARRLFEKVGLLTTSLTDDFTKITPRQQAWVVLPYNPTLSRQHLKLLERYVKRGGRLAVFYNSHAPLAAQLGFDVRAYATQRETWSTVAWTTNAIEGLPSLMAHITQHLLPVRAADAPAITLGHWLNPDDRLDRDLPAAAVSPNGLWFSHVPPLATPGAVQWLAAALAHADPTIAAIRDRHQAERRERDAQAAATAAKLRPAANEIRGVWSPPISASVRSKLMCQLAENKVNALFEHIGSLRDDLPANPARQRQISRAIAQAHAQNLQYHAWLFCWSWDGYPPPWSSDRFLSNTPGSAPTWLDPQHPANREQLLNTVATLAQLGVDGIHLDYIRYPEWVGETPTAVTDTQRDDLTATVAAVAQQVRDINPAIRLSAAVFPTPDSAAALGQDWPAWLANGALDFASPMIYAEDTSRFAQQLAEAIAVAPNAQKIVPGIGVSADSTQLDALGAAQQMEAAREQKTGGTIFFQLTAELLEILRIQRAD